jgi:hypothetical protein
MFFDNAIEMRVDKVQARRRSPVTEQARFDVFEFERLAQQRIIKQINLPDRKIIRRAPVGVYALQFFSIQ